MTDGWGIVAAIATSVSAIVVGFQAWFTRRSVVDTAAALELARQEFARGEDLRVQAERSRIDAEMPRLTVIMGTGFTDPREPGWVAALVETTGHYETSPALARVYVMPRDAETRIDISLQVTVLNDGPRSAALFVSDRLNDDKPDRSIVLGLGETSRFEVTVRRSLRRWIELGVPYIDASGAAPIDESAFELSYTFPGDAGAIENHSVIVGGSIVEREPGNDAGWRVLPFKPEGRYGQVGGGAQPFTRRYRVSRLSEQRL
jgi:hypothetical protein